MVIHGGGGRSDGHRQPLPGGYVLEDHGKGIPDIEKAMQEGYSTASEEAREPGLRSRHGTSQYEKIHRYHAASNCTVGVGTTVRMTVRL